MRKIKLIVAALLLASSFIQAQNFEGTIEWKMTFDITDPKVKNDMATAEKQMNDPKNKAQMAELEKQMNDPEMKAMMDSNPEIKAQMEKVLALAKGGTGMAGMMPSNIIMKSKNNNSIVTMNGAVGYTTLNLVTGESYTIDNHARTYSKNTTHANDTPAATDKYKITKTNETVKILGYNCTKYIITYTESDKNVTHHVWTTSEVKDFDWQKIKNTNNFKRNAEWLNKVDGIPLKIQVQEVTANLTMEVVKIQKEVLSDELFKLPSGYKEVPAPTYGQH